MSIASEISRLMGDSVAIAQAIEAKGVTVPQGSGFDDYASLIASIPQDGGGGSPLPYTPLEYIQTDGTAYINSKVTAKEPIAFDMKVKMNPSISAGEILVGVGNVDGNANTLNGLYHSVNYQGKIGYGYYYLYSSLLTVSSFANPIYVSTFLRNGSCIMGYKAEGGTSYTSATNTRSRTVTTSLPLYIFASNVSGSPRWNAASGTRIYYMRIFCGSSFPMIVFDGVPALYNGEYGLWDNVSNSFFGNQGSGSFSGQ